MVAFDFALMSPATAATLAQVLPVLMLTLLFETKLRAPQRRSLTPLAVVLGFLGNFSLAVAAVVAELALLQTVNSETATRPAQWLWVVSIGLFSVVVLRWAATSVAGQMIRSSAVVKELSAGFRFAFLSFAHNAVEGFVSPAQAVADVLVLLVRTIAEMINALSRLTAQVAEFVARTVNNVIASWTKAVSRALRSLFRRG